MHCNSVNVAAQYKIFTWIVLMYLYQRQTFLYILHKYFLFYLQQPLTRWQLYADNLKNPPVTGGFPSLRASNTESVSIYILTPKCNAYVPLDYTNHITNQGLSSLSGRTSYRKVSWSLEAARFVFRLFQSIWNSTGTSAAAPSSCMSNFRATQLT